ncbi:YaaC family protein [Alteribacillus sp. JSM 102045]|uniref:YaaC family protein n=1 Tax=Alteribacillus sp. JSM 102045 TaxID=1562101 RepID=UPI0035C218B7
MNNNDTALFSYFSPYESQEVLRRWLLETYLLRPDLKKEAYEWSYQNASIFHYEWLIGRNYWIEGIHSSLLVKPLLLFYGLTHLLKGLVLIVDPSYPSTVEVLAHGVTSRKRKKKGYTFLDDEIKIQKKGFFPHFSQFMFHMKHSTGEKWKMSELLLLIEEILPLYCKVKGTGDLPRIDINNSYLMIETPQPIYQEDIKSFSNTLENMGIQLQGIKQVNDTSVSLKINKLTEHQKSLFLENNNQLFLPPLRSAHDRLLPKLCVHYLLLYNLSMICRYEGEWWGELISLQYSEDYPFIKTYLTAAEGSIPSLFKPFFN